MGCRLLIREVQEALLASLPLPLLPSTGSFSSVRGGDGGGYYTNTGTNKAPAVAYVFCSGEVWLISTWPLQLGRITLEEERITGSLERFASLLARLGVPEPYEWIVGLEGVRGFDLAIPSRSNRMFGPCMVNIINERGTYKTGDNATELLRPFFEKVYDQCGLRRPQNSAPSTPRNAAASRK